MIEYIFLIHLIVFEVQTYPTNNQKKNTLLAPPESQHRRSNNLSIIPKKTDYSKYRPKSEVRRGFDIEVKVATKHPKLQFDILKELEKELKNISSIGDSDDLPCAECEKGGKLKLFQSQMRVKPAYPCDDWDSKSRTCWLNRNVGDTVTLVLAFNEGFSPHVQWRQEFHTLHSTERKYFTINSENPLWNIVIGSKGHELRLSPITEIDIDDNFFSAHVQNENSENGAPFLKVNFRIRVMPIDQGFVYPGETLMMNMRRINVPSSSMTFKWYLESDGESSTLPSNMKLSPSGAVLTISELRKEQEGILTCSVFTNLGFFATKQRFLIKEMNQSDNLLLFVPTRPNLFNEEEKNRSKRQLDDDEDEDLYSKTENKQDNMDRLQENMDETSDERNFNNNHIPPNNPYKINKIGVNRKNHFGTHDDDGHIVLEIERVPVNSEINAQDEFSKLISNCEVDADCAIEASCIMDHTKSHFCRCYPGYQGNGIFCWEDSKMKSIERLSEKFEEIESNTQYTESSELIPQYTE